MTVSFNLQFFIFLCITSNNQIMICASFPCWSSNFLKAYYKLRKLRWYIDLCSFDPLSWLDSLSPVSTQKTSSYTRTTLNKEKTTYQHGYSQASQTVDCFNWANWFKNRGSCNWICTMAELIKYQPKQTGDCFNRTNRHRNKRSNWIWTMAGFTKYQIWDGIFENY